MDNYQMPSAGMPQQPVQPMGQPSMPMQPSQPIQPVTEQKKDNSKMILIIAAAVLGVLALLFGVLFLKKAGDYNDLSANIDAQVEQGVATVLDEKISALEQEFAERDKHPYEKFSGPEDYGQLSFEYPRTWNLYVASESGSKGYEAYFNPGQVNAISNKEIYALRLKIVNQQFEDYISKMKTDNLGVTTITVNNGVTANYYSGTIPGTEFQGFIVIFKIRDKTAVLQTDSVLFENDFDTLLESITFNI